MAEDQDQSQKTEEPTERKLQKAREQGQVPRSREVNNFFALLATIICVWLSLPVMFQGLMGLMAGILNEVGTTSVREGGLGGFLAGISIETISKVVPNLLIFMALGLLGSILQTGPMFTVESITPKLSKISPIKGFGRLFSLRALVEFIKSFVKMIILGVVISIILYQHKEDMIMLTDMSIGALAMLVHKIVLQLLGGVLAVSLVLAILDFLYQYFEFIKENRMTRQELQDEVKDTLGDPHIRQRQRQIRMERARMRMMSEVPKAQVVVTNPTHFAVALMYDQEKDAAPKVCAKGADHVARRIRDVARENNIPIVENPPLAQSLYKEADIGEQIPLQHYEAVAKVISYVFNLRKRRG